MRWLKSNGNYNENPEDIGIKGYNVEDLPKEWWNDSKWLGNHENTAPS